jgi:hypothetical protein
MVTLSCLLIFVVSGCGASSSPATNGSGGRAGGGGSDEAGEVTNDAHGEDACPISQQQVNTAFGFPVPSFEMAGATDILCSFNRLGEEARGNSGAEEEPQLLVFPYTPDSPSAASVRQELEEVVDSESGAPGGPTTAEFIAQPQWGKDAGVNIAYNGPGSEIEGASAIILLRTVQLILEYPEASLNSLRATAMSLGNAATG